MFFNNGDHKAEPYLLKYWITGEMKECCKISQVDNKNQATNNTRQKKTTIHVTKTKTKTK